jgi:FtsZ-interacting cell division protein ZipA
VPEEEDSTVLFGLDTLTFSLIVVGIVVFIALIVTSLCTLKYKKNQHNRVASPVVSATTPVRKRDTAQSKELRPVAETDIENNGTPAISAFPHESSE